MRRWPPFAVASALIIILPQFLIASDVHARAVSIAGVCLLLWISELVPPFVPTLLLWTVVPLFLSSIDSRFALANVLSWSMDPVMALFFGGFVLGVATERNGLDKILTQFALRSAGSSFRKFLLFTILITAFLSMWMSNIAAAALVFASLHTILGNFEDDHVLRRVLLVGVALGADLGGIATPIGTGPNAIAIASISATQPVSFLSWMAFAFPLTIGMLLASFLFLAWQARSVEGEWLVENGELPGDILAADELPRRNSEQVGFLIVLIATILMWLSEPLHGISAPLIALGSASILFLSRILSGKDLFRVDWSTLFLIAGGITLGRLLEQSELIKTAAASVPFETFDVTLSLFLLCLTSAVLAALMSNTATAVLLIPLAAALIPSSSTAILIAVSASFGLPFVISTPPNAMAFGHGGVRFGDLFHPGILLMVIGCLIVSLTGRAVLNFAGIP